jgi:hypothetical protein
MHTRIVRGAGRVRLFRAKILVEQLVRRRRLEQSDERCDDTFPAGRAELVDVVLKQLLETRRANPRKCIVF